MDFPSIPRAAALLFAATLAPAADTAFRVRLMPHEGAPIGQGQCDIRVQVDREAEVSLRGAFVRIRGEGRAAVDDGSQCTAPLPERELDGVRLSRKSGPGDITLAAEPDRSNAFTALVRIRDVSGKYGRYQFRLSWNATGADYRDVPPEGRGGAASVLHFAGKGHGEATFAGTPPEPLLNVAVEIDRSGRVQVEFRVGRGSPLLFTGTVMERERSMYKAAVMAAAPRPPVRGTMQISVDARQNVSRISLEATDGRDRLRLEWTRK